MGKTTKREARIFPVETRFHKLVRRPGGLPREQAIERAQAQVEEVKVGFDEWLEAELQELASLLKTLQSGKAEPDWLDTAKLHSHQLRDVGTTVGSELLTFVAESLCEVLESSAADGQRNVESIACHIDSLMLIQKRSYLHLKPEQVPELTDGLRRVAKRANS